MEEFEEILHEDKPLKERQYKESLKKVEIERIKRSCRVCQIVKTIDKFATYQKELILKPSTICKECKRETKMKSNGEDIQIERAIEDD